MVVGSMYMCQEGVSLPQRFLCLPVFTVHALLGDTSQIFKKRANFPSPLTRPGYLRLSFQLLCLPFVYGDTDVYLRHKKVWARVFFYLFFFHWLCCMACRILIPYPGIKPMPPEVEAWSLNHWPTREFPGAVSLEGAAVNCNMLI